MNLPYNLGIDWTAWFNRNVGEIYWCVKWNDVNQHRIIARLVWKEQMQ